MKKIIKYFLLLVIFISCSISVVNAKNKENSLFQYDDNLKIENIINGTAFFCGTDVEINNKINGIGFIAGEKIKINSEQDYLFLLGMNVDLDSNINKDIFIFGENIKINKEVKRDAYVAGTTIVINGNIDRNIYIYGTEVEIKGNIKGNIYANATNIKISDSANISGTLKYNDNAIIEGVNNDIKVNTYSLKDDISLKDYLYSFITNYIGITIVGLVLVYLFDKIFKNSLKEIKTKKDVIKLLSKGFVFLISVPIISLTLLVTGIFSSLAIILLIVYGLFIYISEVFSAYILASYIDKKWINKKLNNYILIILGLFIIKVTSILPIIGGFISFVILLTGIGIISNLVLKLKK